MKIALAQLNYHIGNLPAIRKQIIAAILKAKTQGAELVVFSELAVCGYSPLDLLDSEAFVAACYQSLKEIAGHCTGIAALIGGPAVNPRIEGKNLFNAAFLCADGEVTDVCHKTLLPTYDVFDEYRYFEPNQVFSTFKFKGLEIALTICEDLWNVDGDPLYINTPMDHLSKGQAKLMINMAASPFDYRHRERRLDVLGSNCRLYKLPLLYVNQVGGQTDLIFDGGSIQMNAAGKVMKELNYFSEDVFTAEFDERSGLFISEASEARIIQPDDSAQPPCGTEVLSRIYHALLLGIRDYFDKSGFKKAVLGMSGGIDSALVLALAAEALGKENVLPVLMPSQYSSDHSIADSLAMIEAIGCKHEIIPITDSFQSFEKGLVKQFAGLPFNLTEENMQARIRGVYLMGISNKLGYILLNTSNKSESAVGYGTLYGDMCGGLAVIGDVYKQQVFALCAYINRNGVIIPENIISKPPSAELRPDQKDSDSLPDYALLDAVLYQYIDEGKSADIITGDKALIARVLKLVNTNEYKRFQSPPVLRVSGKAFGTGRRLPIVGVINC